MIISSFLVENQLYKQKYWMKTPWGSYFVLSLTYFADESLDNDQYDRTS